tara:strand:+ start:205 stop:522 length:318 start_codon:yes stop_codon:yes gene_type:complete
MIFPEDVEKIINEYSKPITHPKWRELRPCWVLRCDPVYEKCSNMWEQPMFEEIFCPNICDLNDNNFGKWFLQDMRPHMDYSGNPMMYPRPNNIYHNFGDDPNEVL